MVKENHTQKTVIMPIALEDQLLEYVHKARSKARAEGIAPNQQPTASSVMCEALGDYLTDTVNLI